MYKRFLVGIAMTCCAGYVSATSCDPLPLSRQVEVASAIRESVATYFAHWDPDRERDFATAFKAYTGKVAMNRCRRDFALDSMELVATLRNGHTKFTDEQLWSNSVGATGLAVDYVDGQWRIANSQRLGASPGKEIINIDGEDVEKFYLRFEKYISASSDRARRDKLFNMAPLFPTRFRLKFSDGTTAVVDRSAKPGYWREPVKSVMPTGIRMHAIWDFGDPSSEQHAMDVIAENRDSAALILDVRGNQGGSTPARLMARLIDRPYISWGEMSSMSIGLFKAYGEMHDEAAKGSDKGFAGFSEGMNAYFARPMLYSPGARITPADGTSDKPVYLLADRHCASACEDFVYAMKASGRALVVGESTYGSSGQTKSVDLGDGMELNVGAKRMVFADGSPFEGVGISPDVFVSPTAEDITSNRDVVLEALLDRIDRDLRDNQR